MKKFFNLIAVALISISASAQSEVGSLTWKPNVGITYSTATGDGSDNFKGAIGLTAGVDAMYMVNEKFGASAGLNYTGYNISTDYPSGYDEDNVIYSNYYFNIPIMGNYYVAQNLALKAGIAINILSTAKYDGHDVKDNYQSTFFTIPLGASYEINDFVLEARYNIGVSKVGNVGDGSFNALTFTVGYKF